MFLSRGIDIKLFQNYTKTYICKILYRISSIKQIIFNKYATNLKTRIEERDKLNVGFYYYLNLITFIFNRYHWLYYLCVRNRSPELQPLAVRYYCHVSPAVSRDQYTALPLKGVLVTWYGRISNIYMFWYNFDTVLCQEHQIDVLQVSFNSWDSQVSAYTPFHF